MCVKKSDAKKRTGIGKGCTQMASEGKRFPLEKEGYDVTLVDFYIDTLIEAYRIVYEEHKELRARYMSLYEDYEELEEKTRTESDSKKASKVLAEIESLVGRLLDEASAEAEKIKTEALGVMEDAYSKAAAIEGFAREAESHGSDEYMRALAGS